MQLLSSDIESRIRKGIASADLHRKFRSLTPQSDGDAKLSRQVIGLFKHGSVGPLIDGTPISGELLNCWAVDAHSSGSRKVPRFEMSLVHFGFPKSATAFCLKALRLL
jgi:hypothetical protein